MRAGRFEQTLRNAFAHLEWEKALEKASYPQLKRLWMMEHFRVLPTDERARQVSDEQIDMLFQYWLDYDEEIIRRVYRERQAERLNKPSFRKKDLLGLGYTEEQIAEMAGVVE